MKEDIVVCWMVDWVTFSIWSLVWWSCFNRFGVDFNRLISPILFVKKWSSSNTLSNTVWAVHCNLRKFYIINISNEKEKREEKWKRRMRRDGNIYNEIN